MTSTCLPRQNTSFVATKVSLAGAATSIIFVTTNTCLSWQTRLLSRQKYAYCDKTFVTTNIFVAANFLLREIFVVTNIILTWQNACRDKLTFVATNKSFVATNVLWAKKKQKKKKLLVAVPASDTKVCLSRQKYACPDKSMLVATTKLFVAKYNFVSTKVLSQQLPTVGRWWGAENQKWLISACHWSASLFIIASGLLTTH